MATHSSILGLENPRDREPDGQPSVGSHRVGHDLSNLAAAAAAETYLESPTGRKLFLSYPAGKGRFSPHLATAQPMRDQHGTANGKPPHFQLPISSSGLCLEQPSHFPFSSKSFLSFAKLACGLPYIACPKLKFFACPE